MSGAIIERVSMKDIAAGQLSNIQFRLGQKLIESAKIGDIEAVRKLLKIPGVDVNAADKAGYTALTWAAIYGKVEVVKELLRNEKVDVNAANNDGYTALRWAAIYDEVEVVKVIVNKLGLDVEITE